MRNQIAAFMAMILLAGGQASAIDWLADAPLEVVTAQSELIVVARVIRFAPPAPLTFTVPGPAGGVEVEGRFRLYRLRITRVIKADADAGKSGPSKGRQIEVLGKAPPKPDPGRSP